MMVRAFMLPDQFRLKMPFARQEYARDSSIVPRGRCRRLLQLAIYGYLNLLENTIFSVVACSYRKDVSPMNWSKNSSIELSRICVVLFMILLAALDIGCYWAVQWFVEIRLMYWQYGVLMMVTIYLCSGFGWVLLVRLWQLLQNIRAQLVFDAQNVRLLRQVSWCCVGAGAVCLVSCLYYLPFIAVAIAAGFMALIVRIIKNIFQQAIDMKAELDLTI